MGVIQYHNEFFTTRKRPLQQNNSTINGRRFAPKFIKMKNMKIGRAKEKIYTPKKTIFEHDKDLRLQAIEISKKHIDMKPIKYLLK